jgi:hypothetical protein
MAGWKEKINSVLAHQTKILHIHSNIKLQCFIKQDDKTLLNENRIEIDSSCTLQTVLEHSFKKKTESVLESPCMETQSNSLHAGYILSLCAPCTLPLSLVPCNSEVSI